MLCSQQRYELSTNHMVSSLPSAGLFGSGRHQASAELDTNRAVKTYNWRLLSSGVNRTIRRRCGSQHVIVASSVTGTHGLGSEALHVFGTTKAAAGFTAPLGAALGGAVGAARQTGQLWPG
jgi:hypothetical protein